MEETKTEEEEMIQIEIVDMDYWEYATEEIFEPVEGDSLHVFNEKKVYAAEMSMNKKSMANATK